MGVGVHVIGGSAHWSPLSLVPHLIGPLLIGPPTHWSPNTLMELIGPPSHWSPISLVPHLIGPASHWSPISLPISEPLLCFATPEPVTFFNILSSYDQAPLRAAIKMANPEHDEFRQSRIVSTRHLIRCQYYTLTPQTVMRVEFHPASNMAEHGKWRFYGMPIDNIELV